MPVANAQYSLLRKRKRFIALTVKGDVDLSDLIAENSWLLNERSEFSPVSVSVFKLFGGQEYDCLTIK